jgi:uncharacterized protein involved in exopolysaccharide biosynthesis
MENEDTLTMPVLKESLKLTRNSKGYTWEIRILEINSERLEKINNEMLQRFSIDSE